VEADLFKVQWTQPAEDDLDKIIDEIAKDAPLRAVDFGRRLQELAGSLRWSPHRRPRTSDDPTCRHLIYKKYRIIFEIDEDSRIVWIRAIMFPYQQYRPYDYFRLQ
jgi:plasmid stabilization system protein ParE